MGCKYKTGSCGIKYINKKITMANLTILISILASYALAQIDLNRNHKVLDVRYETGCQQSFDNSRQVQTYKAQMGCKVNNGKFVEVCAELPRNWHWNAMGGYLYMDLYNKEDGAVSDRLNTSRTAPAQAPIRCLTIKSWPGGDLYIKVQSNQEYSPLDFTLSVVVRPTLKPTSKHMTSSSLQSLPVRRSGPSHLRKDMTECEIPRDSSGNYILYMILMTANVEKLEARHSLETRLDVCTVEQTNMRIAVQGRYGVATFWVCTTTPCEADSKNTIASQDTPLVVSSKLFTIPSNISSIYTVVRSLSGKEEPAGSKRYYGYYTLGIIIEAKNS